MRGVGADRAEDRFALTALPDIDLELNAGGSLSTSLGATLPPLPAPFQ